MPRCVDAGATGVHSGQLVVERRAVDEAWEQVESNRWKGAHQEVRPTLAISSQSEAVQCQQAGDGQGSLDKTSIRVPNYVGGRHWKIESERLQAVAGCSSAHPNNPKLSMFSR